MSHLLKTLNEMKVQKRNKEVLHWNNPRSKLAECQELPNGHNDADSIIKLDMTIRRSTYNFANYKSKGSQNYD